MQGDRGLPEDAALSDEAGAEAAAAAAHPRILTPRALLLGFGLTILVGWLVPWNDWTLRNTFLYNNFMPPVISLVLLCFGLAINPLLGRYRLAVGELVVITVMLLGLGGVASSGLNRYLPMVIGSSARVLATTPTLEVLRQDLPPEQAAAVRADFERRIAADVASRDADGDGQLQPAEYPGSEGGFALADADGSGAVSADELAAQIESRDPDAVATWRWPLASALYLGLPEHGPVADDDPEFEYLVGGYLNGFGGEEDMLRVGHRRTVSVERLPDGERLEGLLALSGAEADARRRSGEAFLDLDDPDFGARLIGLRPGEAVALAGAGTRTAAAADSWEATAAAAYGVDGLGSLLARANGADPGGTPSPEVTLPEVWRVTTIEPPAIPWGEWWSKLAAWSPLLLGAFAAMIALAGIVRKQWIENERLPYPVAEVTLSFMGDASPGSRFAAVYRNSGFWIGLAIAAGVLTWNGLHAYGLLPIQVNTTLQLTGTGKPFSGHPWNLALNNWSLYNLRIYFSIVALCFFLSLELSFSLWFFFLLSQVGTILLRMQGVQVEVGTVAEASTGGFVTMIGLIVWVGRHYYWSVVKAALLIDRSDEDARCAAPYLWILLVSCAAMVGFFVTLGAPFWGSVLCVLLFLGLLLVLARILAESGVPFLQLPIGGGVWFTPHLFTAIGFSLPAAALMPLTLIGVTLMADPRESLLPYAVNADYMGAKVKAPRLRLSSLLLAGAALGCVVAFGAMVYYAYTAGSASNDGWSSYLLKRDGFQHIADGIASQSSTEAAAVRAEARGSSLLAYGSGAVIVGLLGAARFAFASWPFHPIGFLTMVTYPTGQIWFSFFLAWLLKGMVLRYGGSGLYRRLKPVAIGLIAGEALTAGGFMLVKIIGEVGFGASLDSYRALPG